MKEIFCRGNQWESIIYVPKIAESNRGIPRDEAFRRQNYRSLES